MKNYLKLLIPKTIFCLTVIAFLTIVIFGCKTDKKQEDPNLSEVNKDSAIEIVTNVMDFQSVDTIPSGWNTFKYVNKSIYAHFFLLDKYPEGKIFKTR